MLAISGCKPDQRAPAPKQQVVLYTAVDDPVARPIIQAFQQQTGIEVILKTDTEATKTAGLAARLEAEKSNPQADVWWGNEVFHTINLARAGVFAPYASPSAADIPAQFKSSDDLWAGTALRARVIAISTGNEAPEFVRKITSLGALTDSQLKDRIAMARPTAGTTGGHMAALYTHMGPEKFEAFLRQLKANNIKLLASNSATAEAAGRGQIWASLTDNDDVDAMKREGGRLEMVLPDQGEGQMGTLTIPCTVAMIQGARNPDAAKKLIDYLLSRQVEQKLLDASFARYSVFQSTGATAARSMQIDYATVADNLRPAVEMCLRILEGRE